MRLTSVVLGLLLAVPGLAGAKGRDGLAVWAVDPLVKVFQDAAPAKGKAVAEVARGEHATLQIVVRSAEGVDGLRASVAPLERKGGEAALEVESVRFVGYVPVDRPTQKPSQDQLRKPPADYPDPLLESESVDVAAGRAQPIWITIPVPVDTPAGKYRGKLTVSGNVAGKAVSAEVPLNVRVYGAAVGKARLWVTNWHGMTSRHMEISPEPESEEYYALMERYGKNMAEHRQNVVILSPLGLAEYSVDENGGLVIDFARFDRHVETFQEAGAIGLIEGGHIGGRKGAWVSEFVANVRYVKDGKVASKRVDPSSPEADAFYAVFFPRLVAHLKERGWLDCYVQHLADEPIPGNIESYRALAQLARKHAPELRIIEACHTRELVGAMDVWVPQLNYLAQDYDHYVERQKAGDEVWFYTCVYPQGEFANRFIEQPLIKTRLLHWINYRYGATGYLHWGYNHWTGDSPFTHTTRAHGGPPYLPAGDPWIVYPGKDGPLDSIRFEAMRDGVADHELLSLLGEKDPQAAQKLAAKHILAFDEYETDVKKFRATRRALLKKLSRK